MHNIHPFFGDRSFPFLGHAPSHVPHPLPANRPLCGPNLGGARGSEDQYFRNCTLRCVLRSISGTLQVHIKETIPESIPRTTLCKLSFVRASRTPWSFCGPDIEPDGRGTESIIYSLQWRGEEYLFLPLFFSSFGTMPILNLFNFIIASVFFRL